MPRASFEADDIVHEDLTCSICLELFTDPITLPNCSHTFCKVCIDQTTRGALESYRYPYNCPQCRRRFLPSDLRQINYHLQSILISKRQAPMTMEHRHGEQMTSPDTHMQEENEANASSEIANVTTFLSTVDDRLQSLLTALDESGETAQGDRSTIHAVRPVMSQQTTLHDEISVCIDQETRRETRVPLYMDYQRESDCEFEAETLHEFCYRSSLICRKHFLLVMFLIHACALVFCFFMAVL